MPSKKLLFNIAFYLLLIASILPVWFFQGFLTADGPCHVYNSGVVNQLLHGEHSFFDQFYILNIHTFPNLASHFTLVVLMQLFSAAVSEKIIITLTAIIFATGFRYLVVCTGKTSALTLWIFPFIWQAAMLMGFYNYMASIGLYFFVAGYWIKHHNELSIKRGVILSVGCLALYFTHLMGVVLMYLTAFLWSLMEIFDKNKSSIRETVKRYSLYFLMFLPSLLFTVNYILHSKKSSNEGKPDLRYLFQNIRRLFSLQGYTGFDITLAKLTAKVLCALFAIAIILSCKKNNRTKQSILFFVFTILCISIYFFAYESMFGGSYLRPRMEALTYTFMLLFISTMELAGMIRYISVAIAGIISILFIGNRLPVYNRIDSFTSEMTSLSKEIDNKSVILPLNYEPYLSDDKGVLANGVLLFAHVSEKIGTNKQLVFLDNYEATTGYFPLLWKENINPFSNLAVGNGFEAPPPNADIPKYNRTNKSINYIIVWGRKGAILDDALTKKIGSVIDSYYVLVTTTPKHKIQLYKLKS